MMNASRLICRVGAALAMLLSPASSAVSQSLYSLETPHLNLLYYSRQQEYIVRHAARCFENAYTFNARLFDFSPAEPVTVLLQDFSDFGNGAAGTVPLDLVSVGMAPISTVYETLPSNERLNWILNHELVHIFTLDRPAPSSALFRSLFFGKVAPRNENPLSMAYAFLTNPRTYTTRWYREGIATFVETWMAGGLGRGLGSYDEMVFRTMVRDSGYFYDPVGLESEGTRIDFQTGANAYLYGTRFMSYLSYLYGPEKLVDWVTPSGGSSLHFYPDFERVYGRSLTDAWDDWVAFERRWQKTNLDSIRLYPVTKYRTITPRTLGSISRCYVDTVSSRLIVAVNYPGQVPHIASIDLMTGDMEMLAEVKGAAGYDVSSLAFDPVRRRVFFVSDNKAWRDLNILDVKSGAVKMLMEDARIGDLVFDRTDESVWGLRHDNGYVSLVNIPPPYTAWHHLYTWSYGHTVYNLDLSPDGSQFVCAAIDVGGRQTLIRMQRDSVRAGRPNADTLASFDISNPESFVFSPDGKYVYGSSYYSGVSNIFRVDLATKRLDALTNAEAGFFRPVPHTADSLLVFAYTGKGFTPVIIGIRPVHDISAIKFLGNEIVDRYPVVRSWNVGSPASVNLDSLGARNRDYSPWSHLRLSNIFPVVEGYKEFVGYGLRASFADRIYLQNFDFTLSYTPNALLDPAERFHASVNYKTTSWLLRAAYNAADFYDLFGPTRYSRKGYALMLQYKDLLVFNEPETMELQLRANAYGGLERLPDAQNVDVSFDRLYSLRAQLHYEFLRKSLGGVDKEKGLAWDIAVQNHLVSDRQYPRVAGELHLGIPLAIDHSSIWLRMHGGVSFGDRNDPFANFFFGGFGNNYVDHQEPKRFRQGESFPGFGINEIGGRNFTRGTVEWALPPLRFSRFGVADFYCSWLDISLFGSALLTNLDDVPTRRTGFSAGIQGNFKLELFSSQDMTLSIGYARGMQPRQRTSDEFMISVKVL